MAQQASKGARVVTGLVVAATSLVVRVTEQTQMNDAARIGFVGGLCLLAWFTYWLAGKIPPLACVICAGAIAAFVVYARDPVAANDPPGTSGVVAPATPASAPVEHVAPVGSTIRLYDKTGMAVDVPANLAAAALTSGNYGLPKGTRLPVVLADGDVGTIAVEEATEAFKDGARVATSAELAAARAARAK